MWNPCSKDSFEVLTLSWCKATEPDNKWHDSTVSCVENCNVVKSFSGDEEDRIQKIDKPHGKIYGACSHHLHRMIFTCKVLTEIIKRSELIVS